MKYRFCWMLTIIAFFVFWANQNVFADGNVKTDVSFLNNSKKLAVIADEGTTEIIETKEPIKYVSINKFVYADNPRYTISGGRPLIYTEFKTVPAIVFASGLTAAFIAQHYAQMSTIWDERGPFNFAEDIKQDLWADKAGHIYGAYLTSYLLSEILMEVGMSWDAASVLGGGLGLAYSTYVEINDGFATKWGFSPSDFYANVIGSVFFIGQHYVPFLQNFTPKFMYVPADWHGEYKRQPSDMFIDDYSSQTFWLSMNIHNMLPDDLKNYWPSWLQLSFGYAARNLIAPGLAEELGIVYDPDIWDIRNDPYVWGSPRYIIALDYDLVKLLPGEGAFWNWMKQSLNHFKLPSPAIEFSSRKTRFYLVYPFSF